MSEHKPKRPVSQREQDQRVHEAFLKRFEKLSQEEKFQTLVETGIVNEDGELTKRYGGTAEPSDSYVSLKEKLRRRKLL